MPADQNLETKTTVYTEPLKLSQQPKTKAIILVVVLLILVLGFLLYKKISDDKHSANQKITNSAYQVLQANIKSNVTNNSKVVSLILSFYQKYPGYATKAQQYNLDTDLTAAYINLGNNSNALKWQLAAIKNTSTASYNDNASLANLYDELGDKAQALQYYKLALSQLNSNPQLKVGSDNLGVTLQENITSLEATN